MAPEGLWRQPWCAGALTLAACALLACPQLMDDDFRSEGAQSGRAGDAGREPIGDPGGSAGQAGSAGRAGGGGAAGNADDAGAGGDGGTAGRGGSAGASAGSSGSAGASGSAGSGGTSGSVACTAGDFAAPSMLSGFALEGSYWGPALSNDGLTLYFAFETEDDSGDLYRTTRADRASPFGIPTALGELNTASDEGTPYVTADGTLYFFSDRSGDADIWRAAPGAGGTFLAPELVPDVNSDAADFLPSLSSDGMRLLFGSYRSGSAGSSDLWVATRPTLDSPFSTLLPVSELNSSSRDEGGSLTVDDLHMFFTSDRSGGAGGLDIWFASRYNVQSGFSPPLDIASVNSTSDDADVHVSRDGSELFFSSSRSGVQRIWRAELNTCP